MLKTLNPRRLQSALQPWARCTSRIFTQQRRVFSSGSDDDCEDEDGDDDLQDAPFPRIGWSPGSFGSRALRRSKARLPGEPTGRTKPKRAEEDYWLEAYEAYGVEARGKSDGDKEE
jgi:hypothetical protein